MDGCIYLHDELYCDVRVVLLVVLDDGRLLLGAVQVSLHHLDEKKKVR